MTNEEMKAIYKNAGIAEADIEKLQEKYDFEKINEIIEAAHSPKEALESIHAFYPELEVAKMQEQMDFIQSQLEAAFKGEKTEIPLELTDEELEQVAGGGFCDWWKKNWGPTATAAVIGVVAGTLVGGMVGGGYGALIGAVIGGATGVAAAYIGTSLNGK